MQTEDIPDVCLLFMKYNKGGGILTPDLMRGSVYLHYTIISIECQWPITTFNLYLTLTWYNFVLDPSPLLRSG